ncbi:dienelactone hydrolase family protein [Hymenobacter lutimineralis]|nr:dienelactone hydrolase family protein [Hymenobacter lutimineralis]
MPRVLSAGVLLALLLFTPGVRAQSVSYAQMLETAARQLSQKNYCEATATFAQAFADSTQAGPFDLYAGAGTAAQCPGRQPQAMRWLLLLSRQPHLSISTRDVDNMAREESLRSLHTLPGWPRFLTNMRQAAARHTTETQRVATVWQSTARGQALPVPAQQGVFVPARPGFALYYAPVDTVQVPYLVYVPATYQPDRRTDLIVYLHGGVATTTQFQAADPGVAQEPIFAIAATRNALVLYPFGRQSFGWLEQRAALDNVHQMIAQVKQRYHVDSRRVYLGGMSNGGTAAFWFACQSPKGFAGFFALSALPVSALGPLNFRQLRRGSPLYSLHAEDDQLYTYPKVAAIYAQHKAQARQWHFLSQPTGGHSFLYAPEGPALLDMVLAQIMQRPAR